MSMVKAFGTGSYGDEGSFDVTCNRCGKTASIVPIHYYNDKLGGKLDKIVVELRCTCGNKFGGTIHGGY